MMQRKCTIQIKQKINELNKVRALKDGLHTELSNMGCGVVTFFSKVLEARPQLMFVSFYSINSS